MPSNKIHSDYLILVPVYNGADYIRRFHQRVPPEFRPQLLFIDDGSTDAGRDLLRALGSRFIGHDGNRGKGAAIRSGLEYARSRGIGQVIVIDVDLQHPPEYLRDFLDFHPRRIQIGYRRDRKTMPLHRKISNFLTSLFISVRTNSVIKDSQCGFRAFPVALFRDLPFVSGGFQFESEMLIRAALRGYRIVHRPIPAVYGDEPTQMNNSKDTLRFIKLWFRSFFWT